MVGHFDYKHRYLIEKNVPKPVKQVSRIVILSLVAFPYRVSILNILLFEWTSWLT